MKNPGTFLITGATGAIGHGIARLIAEEHSLSVVILARNESKAKNTVDLIKKQTGNQNVSYLIADVSRKQEIKSAANAWKGPLDVLINNAAVTPISREETVEGIEMQWATNVLGYFWMMKYFGPHLEKSSPSRIVNVASYWAGDLDMSDLEFKRRHLYK